MRALLDTHALLWWLAGDERLSHPARRFIGDDASRVIVSAASAWEVTTKVRIGRLPSATRLAANFSAILLSQGFEGLDITVAHGQRAGALPGPHKDPFDRMLIAQAQAEDMPLVSNETIFDRYGIRRIW